MTPNGSGSFSMYIHTCALTSITGSPCFSYSGMRTLGSRAQLKTPCPVSPRQPMTLGARNTLTDPPLPASRQDPQWLTPAQSHQSVLQGEQIGGKQEKNIGCICNSINTKYQHNREEQTESFFKFSYILTKGSLALLIKGRKTNNQA